MEHKNWWRFGKFAVFTGALLFADEPIQRFTINTTNNHPGIKKISKKITTFGGLGEVAVLTTFGAYNTFVVCSVIFCLNSPCTNKVSPQLSKALPNIIAIRLG